MIKEIRQLSKKAEIEPVGLRLFRVFSIYFSAVFIKLKVHPNYISLTAIALLITSASMYISGQFVIGALLLLASFLLDCCDGEVARYTNKQSFYGLYLEILHGNLFYGLMFSSLAIGVFLKTGNVLALLFGISALLFKLLVRMNDTHAGRILKTIGRENHSPLELNGESSLFKRVIWEAFTFINRGGGMHIIIILFTLSGFQGFVLLFYGTVMPLIFVVQFYYHSKALLKEKD